VKALQLAENIGGASRARTDDLIVANDALSQLSYSPTRVRNTGLCNAILAAFSAEDQAPFCGIERRRCKLRLCCAHQAVCGYIARYVSRICMLSVRRVSPAIMLV
jgi:hypothetical protein